MRTTAPFVVFASCIAVSACGSSLSGTSVSDAPAGESDAPAGESDAPAGESDAPAGENDAPTDVGQLILSGTTKEISAGGQDAIAGVTVIAYSAADDSVLGTATSAADGTFSMTMAPGSAATGGYLKASMPGTGADADVYKDSYLYPRPGVLAANYTGIPVFVLKASTYDLVNRLLLSNNQIPQNGWLAVLVQDAAGAAVADAVVTSTPTGQIAYNAKGLASAKATATAADGIAYDTNIDAGEVSVTATKPGTTFKTATIKVRPDVVTLTIVTE